MPTTSSRLGDALADRPIPKTNETPALQPTEPTIARAHTDPPQTGTTLAIVRSTPPTSLAESPAVAKLQGYGETAVLCDLNGTPLLKANSTAPIYSAHSSPSRQQVLVDRGSGINEVYRLTPFELVRRLPSMPDVPRASAFGPWNWIDETTLVGVADIERPAAELSHLTGAERESAANWRERTLLYSFSLTDGTLTKIDTARAELPPAFTVVQIRAGGFVKIEWDEQGTTKTAWLAARLQ